MQTGEGERSGTWRWQRQGWGAAGVGEDQPEPSRAPQHPGDSWTEASPAASARQLPHILAPRGRPCPLKYLVSSPGPQRSPPNLSKCCALFGPRLGWVWISSFAGKWSLPRLFRATSELKILRVIKASW